MGSGSTLPLMSDKKPEYDARSRFREALEKKKHKGTTGMGAGPVGGSKVWDGHGGGNVSRRFQRNSGSA